MDLGNQQCRRAQKRTWAQGPSSIRLPDGQGTQEIPLNVNITIGYMTLDTFCNCDSIDRLARLHHQLLDGTPHARAQIQARHPWGEPGTVTTPDTLLQCCQRGCTRIVSDPRLAGSGEVLWAAHHNYAKCNALVCGHDIQCTTAVVELNINKEIISSCVSCYKVYHS